MAETLESRRSGPGRGGMAAVVAVLLVMAAAVPQAVVLADGHEPWRDEIDFEIEEPVEGRRIFVEGLTVSGDRALVTLRAATDVDIRIRAFGGPDGTWLRFLGIRPARPGRDRPLQIPTARPRAVPHRLVGGHPGTGRCAHRRARPHTVPAPRGGGRALRPAHDLPGLGARRGAWRRRVGVRGVHRAPGRASDGGRARERHPDGPHRGRGDGTSPGTVERRLPARRAPASPSSPTAR